MTTSTSAPISQRASAFWGWSNIDDFVVSQREGFTHVRLAYADCASHSMIVGTFGVEATETVRGHVISCRATRVYNSRAQVGCETYKFIGTNLVFVS